MGCAVSVRRVFPADNKQAESWRTPNGNQSHQFETPVIPLNEREVFAITQTWKTINNKIIETGVDMFLRMFESRADVKAMFEQFRTVEKEDLGNNTSLENHALLVMNALDEAIENMDDADYLIDMLLVTGKSHRRFENFSQIIFWAIEEPFVTAVCEALGERFTPYIEKLYRKTIYFILTTLTTGFLYGDQSIPELNVD